MTGAISRRKQALRFWARCLAAIVVSGTAQSVCAKTFHRGTYQFEVAPPPAWVAVHKIPARWDASAPGAHEERWREWLYDRQSNRRGGKRMRYYALAYEAVSPELIGDAGKFQIDFNPDFQKLVIHAVELRRDGKWQNRLDPDSITLARRETQFEQDIATGEVTALIVLRDVRPHDVVRIAYSLIGSNPVLDGLDTERTISRWYFPILDLHFRVLFDPGITPAFHEPPGMPPPRLLHAGNRLEADIDAHGIAAIHDEGDYPKWYSPPGDMFATERRDWSAVAAWARALYPPPKPLPPDLQARIAAWKALPDTDQRIGAALRAVQEEVRYFGEELGSSSHRPAEPAETWSRRYGDCKDKARLLATILNELGVTAYPALVSAREGKAVADYPPSAAAFDHVIVQVRLPDTTLWLDSTLTGQRGPVRALSRAPFGVALVVAPDSRGLTTMHRAPQAINSVSVSEKYTPVEHGQGVTLDIESRFQGDVADLQRRRFQAEDAHTTQRRYADYYRSRFGKVDGDAPVISDDARTGVLTVKEHYMLANPWSSRTGDEIALDLTESSIADAVQMPKVAQRTAPYALTHPLDVTQVIRVSLPPGWRWTNRAEKQALGDAALHFDWAVQSDGKAVSVTSHYKSLAETVPVDAFPAHYELMRRINDAINQRLTFEVPAKDAAKQRDARLHDLMRSLMDEQTPGQQ
jgi:transglutaminase-like putative cysteine protease